MSKIIYLYTAQTHEDPVTVRRPVAAEIAPPTEEVKVELAGEHTAEPIKDIDTINMISEYLISHQRYRDNMMFIVGINFGLRVSDLLSLRFSHLIGDDMCFKNKFQLLEQKTKETRNVKKNRCITINDAVMDAVELYLKNTPGCSLSDFMFRGESRRCDSSKPMTRKSADRILKQINDELNLGIHMSTHTLRKTFGYHQMAMAGNSQRQLLLLQKMFGHSSPAMTLNYIGLTDEEMSAAYTKLNLGSEKNYTKYIDSKLTEETAVPMLA